MSDNILDFGELTGKRVDPEKIIESAKGKGIQEVLVLGWNQEGDMFLGGNMTLEGANYLLDKAKLYLIELEG